MFLLTLIATTANGIGLEGGLFGVGTAMGWADLVGHPIAFHFLDSNTGSLINQGNLSVFSGSQLGLIGRTVSNDGMVDASGGIIATIPVPGDHFVRLSVPGNLLSLEVVPATDNSTLYELLTGETGTHAIDANINADGTISLTGSEISVEIQNTDAEMVPDRDTEEAVAIAIDLQVETPDPSDGKEKVSGLDPEIEDDRLFAESATLLQLRSQTVTLLDRGDSTAAIKRHRYALRTRIRAIFSKRTQTGRRNFISREGSRTIECDRD